jgi:arsenate reductase
MRLIIIGAAAGTSAIEVCLNMTQSNASRHLTILKNCGILIGYKKAQWAYYRISDSFKEEHKSLWAYLQHRIVALPTYQADYEQCEKYKNIDVCANSKITNNKPKVAFVCVHNSCRSQIAEALGKKLAGDVFESYSAGTELKNHINPDAVRLMKKIYGIDMEASQRNKLIEEIPSPDVVITMGCNVNCPVLPCKLKEDWGLEDPSGKSDEEFEKTIQIIESKIIDLKNRLRDN